MDWVAVLGSVFAVHVLAMASPGPNVLIVTQAAMSGTRRAGIATAFGIATGAAVWSSAALVGLNVLFAQAAWLYGALKVLGGAYLLYLAIKLWRGANHAFVPLAGHGAMAGSDGRAFRLGLLTNLTNPKALVFFASLFTALLTPELPAWVKLSAITIIVVDALAWHIALAYLFSTRRAQRAYARAKPWIDRLAGTALALLGLHLLLARA